MTPQSQLVHKETTFASNATSYSRMARGKNRTAYDGLLATFGCSVRLVRLPPPVNICAVRQRNFPRRRAPVRRARDVNASSATRRCWEVHYQSFMPTLTALRSEEHTSELQSPCNLVC